MPNDVVRGAQGTSMRRSAKIVLPEYGAALRHDTRGSSIATGRITVVRAKRKNTCQSCRWSRLSMLLVRGITVRNCMLALFRMFTELVVAVGYISTIITVASSDCHRRVTFPGSFPDSASRRNDKSTPCEPWWLQGAPVRRVTDRLQH